MKNIKYYDLFNEFWQKEMKFSTIPQKENRHVTFNKLYEKVDNPKEKFNLYDIDWYIKEHKASNMQKIQLMFYDYLLSKYNLEFDSDLSTYDLKSTPLEREISILKNTHGIFRIPQLAEEYDKDQSVINDDIKAIENGLFFMNTEIKPKINEVGFDKSYEDTVHPFFLALNKTEAFMMTKELPDIIKKYQNGCEDVSERKKLNLLLGLIERLQMQLSDRAKKDFNINIKNNNKRLKFVSEEEMKKLEEGQLAFMAKRGHVLSKIIVNGIDEYEGYFIYSSKHPGKYAIKLKNDKEVMISDEDEIVFKDY